MGPLSYELFSKQDGLVAHVISNLASHHRLILGVQFSMIIEENLDNVEVKYLVMSAADTPVALVYLVEFKIELLSREFKIAVCGSPFFCADCGIIAVHHYSRDELLPHILQTMQEVVEEHGISAIIIKDIDAPRDILKQAGYYIIPVEPAMAIERRGRWEYFDDYLSDLKPKYKKKIKNAEEKLAEDGYSFEAECDILGNIGRLHELYKNVARRKPKLSNGNFQLEDLPTFLSNLPRFLRVREVNERFFSNLVDEFSDEVDLLVLKRSNRIGAFTLNLMTDNSYHSLFLGMEYSENRVPIIYRGLLSSLIKVAIDKGAETVVLGRTGLLTKAELGAREMSIRCYGKLLDPDFAFLNPVLEKLFMNVPASTAPVRIVFKDQ